MAVNEAGASKAGNEARPIRKQVTVLFCDVVGYTSRSIAMDPEDLADDISRFQQTCRQVIDRHGGHVSSVQGDGIMALFGHPASNEFDPRLAIRAGLDLVYETSRFGHSVSAKPLKIRVGIATGLVVIHPPEESGQPREEQVYGEAPNLAARLQVIAPPDTVVVALRTRRLASAGFRFKNLGGQSLKGFTEPVAAWQVVGESNYLGRQAPTLKRSATRFISRGPELDHLATVSREVKRGEGRLVQISGEAGIGKTRLIRVFEKSLANTGWQRLRISCSPFFQVTPFRPIIDGSCRWLQIGDQDSTLSRQHIVDDGMDAIGLKDSHAHVFFCHLLGLPVPPGAREVDVGAEAHHRLTVEALAEIALNLARLKPMALIFEDLHWADASTIEVVHELAEKIGSAPLMLICTSRTGFDAMSPQGTPQIELPLRGLDRVESRNLVEAIAGSGALAKSMIQTIVEKCDGIPLFLEESSWHMLARFESGDTCALKDNDFSVPDTLQDLLNARLDQLGEARNFIQLAATMGGEFDYSLISQLAQDNGIDADAGMDIMLNADLLSVIPDRAEDRYTFRHALFQDAAYQSLLRKTRQQYHSQIAKRLRSRVPGIAESHPQLLAYHLGESGQVEAALKLWLQAARQSIAQSAMGEALQQLSTARSLADSLPSEFESSHDRLTLLMYLGVVLTARSGYHGREVTQIWSEALELADTVGSMKDRWVALYGHWRCLVSHACFAESMQISHWMKMVSDRSGDERQRLTALGLQAMTKMVSGNFRSAESYYDQSVSLYDPVRDRRMGQQFGPDPYVMIQGLGAVNKLILGKPQTAEREIAESVEMARRIDHPYTIAEALRVAAMYHQIAGDHVELIRYADETVALAKMYGFDGLLAAGNVYLAYGLGMQGGEPHQVGKARAGLLQYEKNYGLLFLPYFTGLLADLMIRFGDYDGATETACAALDLVRAHRESWSSAWLMSLLGQATSQSGSIRPGQPLDPFTEGLKIAKSQGAVIFEQRIRQQMLVTCDRQSALPAPTRYSSRAEP